MLQWLTFRADKTPVKLAVINSLCSSLTAKRADRCLCVSVLCLCVCVFVSEDLSRPEGQLGLFAVAATTWNTDDDDGDDNNSVPSKKKQTGEGKRERERISPHEWLVPSSRLGEQIPADRRSEPTNESERGRSGERNEYRDEANKQSNKREELRREKMVIRCEITLRQVRSRLRPAALWCQLAN